MKILIVGAGPAGLALANFLDSSKHEVKIIEKGKEFSTIGYGLFLLDEGKQILEKLYTPEQLAPYEVDIPNCEYHRANGTMFYKHEYDRIFHVQKGRSITGIRRSDIHHLLLKKLSKDVIVHMGTTVKEISSQKDKSIVRLSNGCVEEYDLVVGADGAHSKVRELEFSSYLNTLPWRCRYMNLPHFFEQYKIEFSPYNVVMCLATPGKDIALILEQEAHSTEQSKQSLYDFFSSTNITHAELDEAFAKSDVYPMRYVYTDGWYKNRTVLIGDAQHAMSPTFGYGTLLALEDAYELAQCLEEGDIHSVLPKFAHRRQRRVQALRAANKFVEFFVLRNNEVFYNIFAKYTSVTKVCINAACAFSRLMLRFG